jgi:DNA-binding response OmpR family regulator
VDEKFWGAGMPKTASVLVVEDNADMAEIYRLALEGEGFMVHCAHSAADAGRLLDTVRPDCVVLDLMLPDSSPVSLSALCHRPEVRSSKLIVVSGRNNVSELARTYMADAYLRKPFDMDQLIELLRQ